VHNSTKEKSLPQYGQWQTQKLFTQQRRWLKKGKTTINVTQPREVEMEKFLTNENEQEHLLPKRIQNKRGASTHCLS
jgi:hypothetical protein